MADELVVQLIRREDGKYIAASTNSPYFCFEGDTEEAVKQQVVAAVAFYQAAQRVRIEGTTRETRITVTRVRPYSRIRHRLLAAA